MDRNQLTPQLQALLRSPEVKQMVAMLSRKDNAALKQATDAAKAGDTEAVKRTLSPLLQDPELAKLLSQLARGR